MQGKLWIGLLAGIFGVTISTALAAPHPRGPSPSSTNNAQVLVTVHARHDKGPEPAVGTDDVVIYENNESRPVVSWTPAESQSEPLDLTILIDDSVTSYLSLQFKDLEDFFPTLPAGTRVRIAYAAFGGDKIAQDFTTDYNLAVKALRIPVGASLAGGSIYQSVQEIVKKWPRDGHRRSLLVVSDGLDINRGTFIESQPEENPDLQLAIDEAQKAGIPVYTIFARGKVALEENLYLLNNGQSCLLRLSTETGGRSYFQGTFTPLAFAPYLKEFSTDLRHQFILTFQPSAATQAGFQRLKVATPLTGVELSAPKRIYIQNRS